jgi:hypothetical protein
MGELMIIGREEDLCCGLVRKQLEQRGRDVLWLPEDRLFPGLDFVWKVWETGVDGFARYAGHEARFEALDSVLARFYGIAVSPETYATKDGQYLCSEWHALTMAWLSALPCPVINRLKPELWYKPKLNTPSLLALVPDSPFRSPRTLITTCFEDCQAFYARCDRRVKYTPLTQTLSYPLENADDLARLEKLIGTLPIQLMEIREGDRVEAFVVGSKALFIGEDGKRFADVPGTIEAGCRNLARRLGLAFCQISLTLNGGKAWCLGADRFPEFYPLRPEIREEIAGELVELMLNGQRSEQA